MIIGCFQLFGFILNLFGLFFSVSVVYPFSVFRFPSILLSVFSVYGFSLWFSLCSGFFALLSILLSILPSHLYPASHLINPTPPLTLPFSPRASLHPHHASGKSDYPSISHTPSIYRPFFRLIVTCMYSTNSTHPTLSSYHTFALHICVLFLGVCEGF